MTRIDKKEEEGQGPDESLEETDKGFGLTPQLSFNLSETKKLIINVNKPDRTVDSSPQLAEDTDAHLEQLALHQDPSELAEEPPYHPPITSWEWNADEDSTTLDLTQSAIPLANVLSFVAQFCPKLHILRLHANVQMFISMESIPNLESDSVVSKDKGVEDSSGIDIFLRCRQPDLPFRTLMAMISSIFPKVSHLTVDGDEQTELNILSYMHSLPDPLLPTIRRLRLEQFKGSLCLLTFFKFVVAHLPHLRFLEISMCDVYSQTGSENDFSDSFLSHLEIFPVHAVPFACLNELVFKAFKNLTQFIAENIAVEHQVFSRLNWTKSGQMSEKLYVKQSSPMKSFNDLLTIVEGFPRICKLETDECGPLERTEILEIVRTCTRLQYFSLVASGYTSLVLAISDQLDRPPISKMNSKCFGKQGGELRLETYDMTLCVPEGAIQEHEQLEIGLQALTNPPSAHFKEDEMVSSIGFRCTTPKTPSFRFERHVKVTLPHSAILHDDPSNVQIGIYNGELWPDTGDVEISTITYIQPSDDTCPRCEVDQEKITVFIDHFSFHWPVFKIHNPFVKGKRLGCLSFLPKVMPPTEKPILRVHLFDKVKGEPEEITQEESECDFRKVHPKREIRVTANVDVTLAMPNGSNGHDDETRTVLYNDIRKKVQNTVDFTLDFSAREEHYALVNLMLTEGDADKKEKIRFNVNFPGNPAARRSRDDRVAEDRLRIAEDGFDQILQKVARKLYLYQDIEDLAVQLGFSIADAKRYFEENKQQLGVTYSGTLNMLRTWRRGVDQSQERAGLRDALLGAKQIRLVSTLLGEGD